MSLRYSFLLLAAMALADGPQKGRAGNGLYQEQRYEEAAIAYQAGLEDTKEAARFGLLNNLGAALFRLGNFTEAREAFTQALSSASAGADLARAAYNAGNTAYAAKELEQALDYYQRALLVNPTDEDARFNYEYVKRRLKDQQDQQQEQGQSDGQQQQDPQQNSGSNPAEQNQDEQQQDQQNEEQEDQESQGQEGDKQQEGQQQDDRATSTRPDPNQLSKEQAEQILEAIQQEEEQLLREAQKLNARPQSVEKDW